MACTDCFSKCVGSKIKDECVIYTLESNDTIGTSEGLPLSYNLDKIVDYITSIASGNSLSVTYKEGALCTLNETVTETISDFASNIKKRLCEIQFQIDTTFIIRTPSDDFDCIEQPDDSSLEGYLRNTMAKVCSIATEIAGIKTDYVKNEDLCTKVQECLDEVDNSPVTVQENTKMSKYIAYDYHGPLDAFDGSGSGIEAKGYKNVYICLGQTVNGFKLPDYRGRSSIMVNVGVSTSGVDSVVSAALNPSYQITLGNKFGSYTHVLTSGQNGPHTHVITDNGHTHASSNWKNQANVGSGGSSASRNNIASDTELAYTGITISSSGNGEPHNNLHPVVGCVKIMYIP